MAELTEAQWVLLRGLVARAAQTEAERVARMQARPRGSHAPGKLAEAEALASDLAALEAVMEAGRDAGLSSLVPGHECDLTVEGLVYQGHVAAPGYGVSFTCATCGRPWLKIGSGFVDPSEQVYELSPEDVR